MQATTWACACSESSRGCDAADGVRDATLHVGSPSLSLLPAALPVAWCAASIAMPHKEQTDEIYLVDMVMIFFRSRHFRWFFRWFFRRDRGKVTSFSVSN